MSYGQKVSIRFRFRVSVTAQRGKLMHLVSNCCQGCEGDPEPSLDIAIIPSATGGIAVFATTTSESGEVFVFVPYQDTVSSAPAICNA